MLDHYSLRPTGKRELLARLSNSVGFTSLLQAMPRRHVLLVLNYHRIGNAEEAVYDPGVFSATVDEFDDQVCYLKRHFHMFTLEEAVAIVNREEPLRTGVLITFDDGYRDNYTQAFPVLRSHGVQGTFFLPTSFVGTSLLPFWDVIAYAIRHSGKEEIVVDYPEAARFDLKPNSVRRTLRAIMRRCKRLTAADREMFIDALQDACGVRPPRKHGARLFMNWDEVLEMYAGGMAFGSHTRTHEVLRALSFEKQVDEVRESRRILEEHTRVCIDTLSYPNGRTWTFSNETKRALRESGYRAAFSFYGGINRSEDLDPLDVRRCSIERLSPPRFQWETAWAAVAGTASF